MKTKEDYIYLLIDDVNSITKCFQLKIFFLKFKVNGISNFLLNIGFGEK